MAARRLVWQAAYGDVSGRGEGVMSVSGTPYEPGALQPKAAEALGGDVSAIHRSRLPAEVLASIYRTTVEASVAFSGARCGST